MRKFEIFDLKEETSVIMNRRLELPNFILTKDDDDVNEERITVKDVIRLIALAGIVWFFCYIDSNVMVGLIGLIASTAVLCMTGGDR